MWERNKCMPRHHSGTPVYREWPPKMRNSAPPLQGGREPAQVTTLGMLVWAARVCQVEAGAASEHYLATFHPIAAKQATHK